MIATNLGKPSVGGFGPLLDLVLEALPLLGMEITETEILHLHLDATDPEPIGDGRVDVQGLLSDGHLAIPTQVAQGPHVVQPIGELDQNHPHVVHGRQQESPEILRLGGFTSS